MKHLHYKSWMLVLIMMCAGIGVSWGQNVTTSECNAKGGPIEISPEMHAYIDHLSGKDKPASARKAPRKAAASATWSYPGSTPATPFGGGTGTEADPYLITSAQELANLSYMVNNGNSYSGKYFKMTRDIVLNDNVLAEDGSLNPGDYKSWVPIGNESNYFSGNFDGDRHCVSGVYINASGSSYQGLFGSCSGKITNIGLTDGYIYGYSDVGAICGACFGASITNSYNEATVQGKVEYIGGIVGHTYQGSTINRCYNNGSITATTGINQNYIGGIVGWASGKTVINNCYNTAKISGCNNYVGGIVGALECSGSSIEKSFNIGIVSSLPTYINGPIVAWCLESFGTANDCYYEQGCCINRNQSISDNIKEIAYSATAFADGTVLSLLDPEGTYFYQGEEYPMLIGVGTQSSNLPHALRSLSTYIETLDGYDALAAELNTYVAQAEQAIADSIEIDAQRALAAQIDSVLQLSRSIEEEYGLISGLVDEYVEIVQLVNSVDLKNKYVAAQQILSSKATYVLSSYNDLIKAKNELQEAIDALELNNSTLADWTSTNHNSGSSSSFTWNFSASAGQELSFDWAVSSESGCDWLIVYLNGNTILERSGELSGHCSSILSSSGDMTLHATYTKDGSVDNGTDNATVFNIMGGRSKLWLLSDLRKEVLAYIATLDSLPALQAELQTAYSNAVVDSIAQVDAVYAELDSIYQLAKSLDVVYPDALSELSNLLKANSEIIKIIKNESVDATYAKVEAFINADKAVSLTSYGEMLNLQEELQNVVNNSYGAGTKVWDFAISEETKAKLYYTSYNYGNWSNSGSYYYEGGDWSSGYYYQLRTWAINEYGNWQEEVIPETEGLYFNRGGYSWRWYTDGTSRIYNGNSGTSYSIKLPNLKTGQEITVNFTTSSSGNTRYIYSNSDNLQLTAGSSSTTSTGEVTYTVTADGDAIIYPSNGSLYINSISLTHAAPNDIWKLSELRKEVAAYVATLDSLPGLKAELQAAYDKAIVDSIPQIDEVYDELINIFNNVKTAVADYPVIVSDLALADSILTLGAYVDIAEAVELGKAVDVATSQSTSYFVAYDALETSLAIYNSDQVNMASWSFGTSVQIDGKSYTLDTTNKVARFNGLSSTSTDNSLVLPAFVRYNEETYAVVSMVGNTSYTQPNITSVSLPKSLRYIGDYAFYYYSNLRNIVIPENVTTMGSYVFESCPVLRDIKVEAEVPPTVSSLSGANYKKVTVPEGCFHAYRLASQWSSCILIGGDEGVTVTIDKMAPGELSSFVIDEAGYLQEVNNLIIEKGSFNNTDWATIKEMSNLISLDLSGVATTSIPSSQFYGKYAIEKLVLPNTTQTIGSQAFQNTYLKEIVMPESLTTINDYAFQNCDSLQSVVVPAGVKTIPNYCFYDCDNLEKVVLPDSLTTIYGQAFYSCDKLKDIQLPSGVTTINSEAFRNCTSLSHVNLPAVTSMGNNVFYSCTNLERVEMSEGLISIPSYTFYNCTRLDSIAFPCSLQTINSQAFYNCTSLKTIEFAEGLKNLYSHAFQNCTSLAEVSLPSSLQNCTEAPFYGCTNLKRIEARSMIAPVTSGYCPLSNVDMTNVVLYVPTVSQNEYKSSPGWSSFVTVLPSLYLPENISVNKDFYFTFRDSLAANYAPNIDLIWTSNSYTDDHGYSNYQRGNLSISSRSALNVNNFSLYVSPYAKYYADRNVYNNYSYDNYRTQYNSTSLIVNGAMRAENVNMHMINYGSRWQFVTFPFDVKVSDIVPDDENTSWVIRGHSGAMRAAAKTDSVWVNLSADDVLEAGKGYIMHCYNPSGSVVQFTVTPLTTSVNRQLIFSSEDRTIDLEENLAEFEHNRSWNLIGNPYPAFFDSRYLDFGAPFMVWNSYSQNYVAYNPADDAYILSPGEAFFVQRPIDEESITFLRDGRQINRYAREMTDIVRHAKARTQRYVYNITLGDDEMSDRTRVVFNEAADKAYELDKDASKFASTEKSVPQIFTLQGNTRYAINERPADNGVVTLGVYCGSAGSYTLSIDSNDPVVLEDKEMGISVEISAEKGYVFSAKAGEATNRFVLYFSDSATGINGVNAESGSEPTYTVSGARATKNAKGVVIKNGKKSVVK